MNKVLKKIGSAIVDIIIVVLILLSIVISISSFTAKANNGVPDLFGYTPFSVQSDSMLPTLAVGDYILVEECDAENLQVGDIVSYHTIIEGQKTINTHRIVDVIVNEDFVEYQTQGDNKESPDEVLIQASDVVGKYNGKRVPFLGAAIDYLSTQMGFFIFILLPVLLFTIYQIYKLIAVVLYNKKVDMIKAVNDNATDEVKEAIIAEYLAKQKKDEADKENASD